MTDDAPVVLKFGGRSLSQPERVVRYVERVRATGVPTVVVVSARRGVTDLLRAAVERPRSSRPGEIMARLRARHPGLTGEGERLVEQAGALAGELPGRPSAVARDRFLSQGERISAHWISERFRERGIPAVAVEADQLGLLTDNSYGASRILLAPSAGPVRRRLRRLLRAGKVPVVTGFFGRSLEGHVATLGRGGSDYSAAAIGALLGAARVELVKRDVALFTADPRLVPGARRIPRLSYEDAAEFAQFGARVLHPVTIEPVRRAQVELRVQSLRDPSVVTIIGPARGLPSTRSVSRLGPLRDLSIRVAGGRQRPGILAEVFRRLHEGGVNIVAIVSTESVIGLLLEPADVGRAREVLAPLTDSAGVVVGRPTPVSLVSVIGEGVLREVPRVPRWILASARGLLATRHSISLVLPGRTDVRAVRHLHRAYVEEPLTPPAAFGEPARSKEPSRPLPRPSGGLPAVAPVETVPEGTLASFPVAGAIERKRRAKLGGLFGVDVKAIFMRGHPATAGPSAPLPRRTGAAPPIRARRR